MRKTVLLFSAVMIFLVSQLFSEGKINMVPLLCNAEDDLWKLVSGKYVINRDEVLGKNVLTADKGQNLRIESKKMFGPGMVYKATVRLKTDVVPNAHARFYISARGGGSYGYSLLMSANKPSDMVYCNIYDINGAGIKPPKMPKDWDPGYAASEYFPSSFSYKLKAYDKILPGWDEDFRIRIEKDMSSIPDHNKKWLEVRIEHRKDNIKFWIDDRLISEKQGNEADTEGYAWIEMAQGAQLLSYSIEKISEVKDGFMPVSIRGYVNTKELTEKQSVNYDSMTITGDCVEVGGVPFVLPGINTEGNDHIDVGRSLFRLANGEGYFPSTYGTHRFEGSTERDPARIQLRIPNGQYDCLYVLAGYDNEKDNIPLVSAMFYRPHCGFAETFEGTVPAVDAEKSDAVKFPVILKNGKQANLWLVKIPLDPAKIGSFSDLSVIEIELTKKVYQYRSYPDPISYGWHQGGFPSGVHVYGVTLGRAPVGFDFSPEQFGHVWRDFETPGYISTLTNNTDKTLQGKIAISATSYDGTDRINIEKPVSVNKRESTAVKVQLPVKLFGYYDISATLNIAGKQWTEKRSFVKLAPDKRAEKWTEGKGALFGYWSYHGGHYQPKSEHHVRLMTWAGARVSMGYRDDELAKKHWSRSPAGAWEVGGQAWAMEEPYDTKKYEEYQQTVIKAYTEARKNIPDEFKPDHVFFFPEPGISERLTAGNYPEYWQEKPYEYTKDEKDRIRMYFVTAKCAAEAVRKAFPDLKILIPWGDPLFIVPLLRAGFPKDLIDGSGLDICHFERLPEQQLHQISVHRLYELKKEYEKAGIPNPELYYCEGIFVPTEVGACSWREQMDIHDRWTLISMTYGIKRFYSGHFAFDAGSYYGAEHYGGCGIQRRIPYCDPKLAYASYATMTDKLNEVNFDTWLKTGSLTAYCLKFKGPKGYVYTLWNIRGERPVTVTFAGDAEILVTDAMNNSKTVKTVDKKIIVTINASVKYLTTNADVVGVELGEPDNSDAKLAEVSSQVADLGDGTWKYTSQQDTLYEHNTFAVMKYLGKFSTRIETDEKFGNVLVSKLEKQDAVHELMPWYNTLTPANTVVIPGRASVIGLWIKGASDWGRVIYCLRDAKGERWVSIGEQDQWNCDDVHSWSYVNFDGWRYVKFELPSHVGYDNFRRYGATWWRCEGGDRIVDLPLSVEKIIVEQRTNVMYVNGVQPVAGDEVKFGKLIVEYETSADMTQEEINASRIRSPLPTGSFDLPNPIKEMEAENTAEPTEVTKLQDPEHQYDGTRAHVFFKEYEGAKNYFVWVGCYPDGRGAVNMTLNGIKNGGLIWGLRPKVKFYFWVTYQDKDGRPSKPSKPLEAVLIDKFKEK